MFVSLAILLFLLSVTLGKLFQHLARKKAWFDIPNNRSSHQVATPRGGGIVFMGLWLGFVSVAAWQEWLSLAQWRLIFFVPLIIGGMGFWDDLCVLSAKKRLFVQLAVGAWVVCDLVLQNRLPSWPIYLGGIWGASVFMGLALVWFINAFNFMDGLDGLAASEAVVILVLGGYFLWLSGALTLAYLAWLMASCVLGFLRWNWPVARVFMGDAGSMTLGAVIVLLAFLGQAHLPRALSLWAILSAVFWFDASITLLRRYLGGCAWMSAHKAHAYQRLHQTGWKVSNILMGNFCLNMGLGFIACRVYHEQLSEAAGLAIAVGGLSLIYGWIERKKPMRVTEQGMVA